MAEIFHTAKEYAANAVTFVRGTAADVTGVGVYHNVDANVIPEVGDFDTVALIEPGDPLAEGSLTDVLSRMSGIGGGGDIALAAGDYQRWVLLQTAMENIIRKVDVFSVL